MTMLDPRIADAVARLPDYLSGHVLVSAAALALGLAASLPLAFLSMRRPALRGALLVFASVVQTIPGLALLALFYPLLLALAALSARLFGFEFSALGFLPAVLALALYSMLPVVRNTIAGLAGIDADIREAAAGVGMTPRQSLLMVELPLAVPMIMAGVRTASVWVIGTATLSTPIGQTSLGNYIFAGLQTQNWIFVLFGCVAAAALALVVDQLLALVETGLRSRGRARVAFGLVGLLLVVTAALAPAHSRPQARYLIGAKPFTEQYVLAALIEQRLRAAGLPAGQKDGLGSSVIFDALVAGEIDAYVDYTGTIWANALKRADVKSRAEVMAEVGEWLAARHGVRMLGGLGFENAYALAMPRGRAQALGVRSIADLARHAPRLSIAGDYEFFARPEWKAMRDAYHLAFREERQMQQNFMYRAAAGGEIDVIAAYSSDGQIAQFHLSVLDDPLQAIPPYDAILLVAPKRARDRAFIDALTPLVGALDVATMRQANLRAAGGGATSAPREVALWLARRMRPPR
ncbi:MAG: ABC transporter permease/substrate-binding protein [Proteobacteria bacterium]|nr:ABC transporter permease/substrate-binding protein [Pseudomonadota bacterium]